MDANIDPAIDPQRFREVLGHLPTGVTVVTAHHARGPVAMSANSVTSVSLEPPLILFCPAKTSSTWPAIRESGRFCVNVFAAHHEEISRRFAARGAQEFSSNSQGNLGSWGADRFSCHFPVRPHTALWRLHKGSKSHC